MTTHDIHATKHKAKIALITGGSSGIGLATARRLALEGATVVVTGRRQAELDAAVGVIGHGASGIRGDIANLADLDVLFAAIKERHVHLDIVFANAGVGDLEPLGAITEASVDRILGVNVKGTLFTIQKALPLMSAGGAIVICGSMAASKGYRRSAFTPRARRRCARSPAVGPRTSRTAASA